MNLTEANVGESCIVKDIATDDESCKRFCFVWAATAEKLLRSFRVKNPDIR